LNKLVAVPHLEGAVLAPRPAIVRARHKFHGHYAVCVRVHALVAVTKVQAPYLEVLVGAAGRTQRLPGDGFQDSGLAIEALGFRVWILGCSLKG